MKKRTYRTLGLMSGSSLDGLDVAPCRFELAAGKTFKLLDWKIEQAATLPYSEEWKSRLIQLIHADARTFAKTHVHYARYIGALVNSFLKRHQFEPDFIAAHGHTIFHFPEEQFTTQIGEGAALSAVTGYPVVCDFRTQDVAQGGQGAPIASIADKYFFSDYDFCLNLGGIANITAQVNGKYIAFDISGANQILNAIVEEIGLEYDNQGKLAAKGALITRLFNACNHLSFLQENYPKTLDNQWVKNKLIPLFKDKEETLEDRLHTACAHIAHQVAKSVKNILQHEQLHKSTYELLVTGGGGYNDFLMQLLRRELGELRVNVHLPDEILIGFKEAAMIALMGVMRIESIPNCMGSVTGARVDTINGAIYQGMEISSHPTTSPF
ncbi:MAG: anhydro-N-acetylmuramic acid kinase [Bacteroidota bacterium]